MRPTSHAHARVRLQGFTSSTGKAWEKHDVLNWYFCEVIGCPRLREDPKWIQWYT